MICDPSFPPCARPDLYEAIRCPPGYQLRRAIGADLPPMEPDKPFAMANPVIALGFIAMLVTGFGLAMWSLAKQDGRRRA